MRTTTGRAPGFWVVLGYVLIVSSPWISGQLVDAETRNRFVQWLVYVLRYPNWVLPPAPLLNNTQPVLFVVLAWLGLWLTFRGQVDRRRAEVFLSVAAVIMAAAVVSAVLGSMALVITDEYRELELDGLLVNEIVTGLSFGVLFGVVVGAVVVGRIAAPVVNSRQRQTISGTAMSMVEWSGQAERSEATRALCTGMYVDEQFADATTRTLLADDLDAIAVSRAVDLRPVLLHGLAALRRARTRDAVLSVTLLATILLCFLSILLLPVGLLVALALIVQDKLGKQQLLRQLSRTRFRHSPNPDDDVDEEVTERLAAIDEAQRGNVTVFSGYRPFIGYGGTVSGWQLALPIRASNGLDGKTPSAAVVPFTAAELTDSVRTRLLAVAAESEGVPFGEHLKGLQLEDRVFVSGTAISEDERFLAKRETAPETTLTTEQLSEIAADPTGRARYYLGAHVPSWAGQIVASTFLRLSTDGAMLYTECDRTVLGPVKRNYLAPERTSRETSSTEVRHAASQAVQNYVPDLLGAPFRLIRALNFRASCRYRSEDAHRSAAENRDHDHGAKISVRETAVDPNYHHYYQVADATKHLTIVQRHVLEATIDFLDAHNVDTTELRERSLTILNEGVIQTGGVSTIGVQAVGKQATAQQAASQESK